LFGLPTYGWVGEQFTIYEEIMTRVFSAQHDQLAKANGHVAKAKVGRK